MGDIWPKMGDFSAFYLQISELIAQINEKVVGLFCHKYAIISLICA